MKNRTTRAGLRTLLLALGLLTLVPESPACAEIRVVGVHVVRDADSRASVSIVSQVESENRIGVPITEAAEILRAAKGWGSSIVVGIVSRWSEK